ncbi:MAG: hypothetical protein EBZ77_06455, partial [Chitinophagia bacterium]|nr:hypothetical protein [Chitinophagia bacterium]
DLKKSPNDCRLSYYLGTALAETQYELEKEPSARKNIDMESLEHLNRAIAMYPQFTEANAELGRVYDREGMYDSAIKYDRIAIGLNPQHSIATNNLGSVYLATGKYDSAAITFRKAIAIKPDFQLAYFNLARTFNALRVYDSAIRYYTATIAMYAARQAAPDQTYLDCWQEKGMAFFSKMNYDSATLCFNQVLQLATYLNMKNYKGAIDMFNKSLAINPNNPNAWSNIGRGYYFDKQYAQAIQAFTKQLQLNNKAYENIPYIALSYKELGDMANARQYEAIAKRFYNNFSL